MTRKMLFPLFVGLFMLLAACKQKSSQTQTTTAQAAVTFANETDYICGMKVQPEFTDTCYYNGKVYGFCSESCKDEFKANPESFLNKASK